MDGHHHYEIHLKQQELNIQLLSDDVYFISKQLDKWFAALLDSSYTPVGAPPPPMTPAAPPPPVAAPELPADALPPTPEVPAAPPPFIRNTETAPPAPVAATPVAPPAEPTAPEPATLTITHPTLTQSVKDDFEAVMDSLMEDLGKGEEPSPPPPPPSAMVETVVTQPANSDTPSKGLGFISSLADLCQNARANMAEDYLMLAAYYLTYIEAETKFSLKRLSALMVQSGLTPANHSTLENAVSRKWLALVPDMTGMAEATEYTLTDQGQVYTETMF